MELFVRIVHGFCWLTIFVDQSSILDVRVCSEYASSDSNPLLIFSKNGAFDLFANQAPIDTFLK